MLNFNPHLYHTTDDSMDLGNYEKQFVRDDETYDINPMSDAYYDDKMG